MSELYSGDWAMVCAGFTGGEADQLRKSMWTFKFTGGISRYRDKSYGNDKNERWPQKKVSAEIPTFL